MGFRRRYRSVLLLAVATGAISFAVAAGCGLDAVGNARTDLGGDDSGLPEGSVVVFEDGATCTTTGPERCDDGLDNDCNGLTDCADPACSTHACMDVPAGWRLVTVTKSRAPTADGGADAGEDAGPIDCPSGWSNGRVLVDTPRVEGTDCTCRCGVTPATTNPCTPGGTFSVNVDDNNNGVCSDRTVNVTVDGACTAIFNWNGSGGVDRLEFAGVGPTNVTCPGLPPALPSVVDDGALAICDLLSDAGACTTGACVEKPGTFAMCLAHAGIEATCPTGFGVPRVMRTGAGVVDGRTCNPGCACTTSTTTCSQRRLDFFSDNLCATLMRSVVTDNGCNVPSGAGTPVRYKYAATPDTTACVANPLTVGVDGGLTLPPEITVCCPP